MKIKKTTYSTQICDLYGRNDYANHIELNREYWWMWPEDSDVARYTGQCWNKLKVSYLRSGCVFYILPEFPDFGEHFFAASCFLASTLILADINPEKDIKFEEDIEMAKKKYRFDDTRTVVNNWPNERESEIDENELLDKYPEDYIHVKLMEII